MFLGSNRSSQAEEIGIVVAVAAFVWWMVHRPGASAPSSPSLPHTEVPARKTFSNLASMLGAFALEWRERHGNDQASPETLATVLAHSALETGRWASMYNWNPGFITTRSGAYFTVPDNPLHFQVWPDQFAGVGGMLDYLRRACPPAWSALENGDPAAYAHALKVCNYYGDADEGTYTESLLRLYREFLPLVTAALEGGTAKRIRRVK